MASLFNKIALPLFITVLFFATPARAVPIVFTDLAAWQAAVAAVPMSNTRIEDFESATVGPLVPGTNDIGRFNVTIDNNDEGDVRIRNSGSVNGTREFRGDLDNDGTMMLQFSFPILFGFAGDWDSTTSGDSLTMTINGDEIRFEDFLSGDGDGFLGVIDLDGFSQIDFGRLSETSVGEAFSLDNARLARVPETGASWMLLGFSLVALSGLSAVLRRMAGDGV